MRPAILGTHAHGRFQLVARLGEGAHGEVFEAIDRARGTRVAVKALRDVSPRGILRFKQEFRSLVALHHVNLVELGELFEDAGRWCFSMELVQGQDFVSHVRGDSGRLIAALHQLGCGLQALHKAGKIHRDIKPSNIRVQPDGRVVLLDFGLVVRSEADSVSDVERVVGSVGYMAPEQADGQPLSPAADCYAVGVLIYEALTGEQPFNGSVLDVLRMKQAQSVQLPAAISATLPTDLVGLCHALCCIDPAQRASIDELLVRTGKTVPQARASETSLCFGRERELLLLDQALEKARAGTLSKVRLRGASGVGKTALLRAFRERLRARDEQVFGLSGSCHEQERVTHNAFDAAVDELGASLERLSREQCARLAPKHVAALVSVFPVLGRLLACSEGRARLLPPDPITLRRQAYAGLRDLLQRMAEHAPVVLTLDDLQWSDAESLELLAALTHAPDPPPLLLLAAMWPAQDCSAQLHESLVHTFSEDDTQEIEVAALPAEAAVELARHLLEALPERSAKQSPERIAEAAGGHPFFIEVLARAAQPVSDAPCRLEEALWSEISGLSAGARELLQLIAVAGAAIAESTLAEAAGLSAEDLAEALAELRRGKFVRMHRVTEAPSVSPHHAKICSALLAHVDALSVQKSHLALANALARGTCRDPEALAVHWSRAGQLDNAARCFVQAAAIAQRARAFDHAAQLYRSALAASASSEQCRRWRQELALALAQAGRNVEAAEAYVAAAVGCEAPQARELLRHAAVHYLRAGMAQEGLAIARPLLAEIGEKLALSNSAALASLAWQRTRLDMRGTRLRERPASESSKWERYACDLLWSISVPLTGLDFVRGVDLHHRCLLHALRLGDPARAARSLSLHALYMKNAGPEGELRVRGLLATADTLARGTRDPCLIGFSQICHSTFQLFYGEPARALQVADAAATVFEEECENASWEIGVSRVNALNALTFLGEFRELGVRFETAAEEARVRGNVHAFTTLVTMNRCTLDIVADRPDECRSELHRLMADCPADWHLQYSFALGAHVMLDLYAGGDAAHVRLTAHWRELRQRLILTSERFRIFFCFVRGLGALAALASDQHDRKALIRLVRSCAAQLARECMADAKGSAHMLRGQLAVYRGDLTAAVHEYRGAAEVWGRAGMFGSKIASLRLGEILAGEQGAALIDASMRWAREQGIRRPEQFFRAFAPVVARLHT